MNERYDITKAFEALMKKAAPYVFIRDQDNDGGWKSFSLQELHDQNPARAAFHEGRFCGRFETLAVLPVMVIADDNGKVPERVDIANEFRLLQSRLFKIIEDEQK